MPARIPPLLQGLGHSDSGVKALCVDLTGLLVRGLCQEALAVSVS